MTWRQYLPVPEPTNLVYLILLTGKTKQFKMIWRKYLPVSDSSLLVYVILVNLDNGQVKLENRLE